jgi:hypothetical protein
MNLPNKRRRGRPPIHDHRGENRTNVFVERAKALNAAGVPGVRLLDKPTIMAVTGCSFPTIWDWMRKGKFPKGRIVGVCCV